MWPLKGSALAPCIRQSELLLVLAISITDKRAMSHFLLFSIIAAISSLPFISSQECNREDMLALLQIKKSVGNPSEFSSWDLKNASQCCSSWQGVACGADGHVISLTMFFIPNYSGPIPPAVAGLKSLEHLDLGFSNFTGPIPTFLCNMSGINYLRLVASQLSGNIPSCLMSKLAKPPASLKLYGNQLTGEIPKSFGKVDFKELELHINQLTGDLTFLQGAKLPSLDYLSLSYNQFKFDLSTVQFPQSLASLDLRHNKVYGSIPQSITMLKKLQFLDLRHNLLCGRVPQQLANITTVKLRNNKCLCGDLLGLNPCK